MAESDFEQENEVPPPLCPARGLWLLHQEDDESLITVNAENTVLWKCRTRC